MMTTIVIDTCMVVALIIGFCFERQIALAERRFVKKLFAKKQAKKEREARAKRMLREARYIRAQQEREMELLELGLDFTPSLKVVAAPHEEKEDTLKEDIA